MSLKFKLAAGLALLALFGVGGFEFLLLRYGHQELDRQRLASGQREAALLARQVAPALIDDALWEIHAALRDFAAAHPGDLAPEATVLDRGGRVYATTVQPSRDLLLQPVSALGGIYGALAPGVAPVRPRTDLHGDGHLLVSSPVEWDGVRQGTVLVDYRNPRTRQHFASLVYQASFYALGLFLLLALGGWLLVARVLRPLEQLGRCMDEVGRGRLAPVCTLPEGRDEVGRLVRVFRTMLAGLRDNAELQTRMMNNEHLAALGRLAAGVAHEMNNPLGGMLTAVALHRRHPDDAALAVRTLDLLERGLEQLRGTVQALLVETRTQQRPLTGADLDDVRRLMAADARHKSLGLAWDCSLDRDPISLPAPAIRRVLINLVLNAIRAAPANTEIRVVFRRKGAYYRFEVLDHGPGIPEHRRQRVFEPFVSFSGGSGLGLWVSHQVVDGLAGTIRIESPEHAGTRVVVELPAADQPSPAPKIEPHHD